MNAQDEVSKLEELRCAAMTASVARQLEVLLFKTARARVTLAPCVRLVVASRF